MFLARDFSFHMLLSRNTRNNETYGIETISKQYNNLTTMWNRNELMVLITQHESSV